jgi:hypothetical protein
MVHASGPLDPPLGEVPGSAREPARPELLGWHGAGRWAPGLAWCRAMGSWAGMVPGDGLLGWHGAGRWAPGLAWCPAMNSWLAGICSRPGAWLDLMVLPEEAGFPIGASSDAYWRPGVR